MIRRHEVAATLLGLLAATVLAACAQPLAGQVAGNPGPAAGMCLEGQPDCVDTPQLGDPMPIDQTGIRQLRKDAKFYLGVPRDQLNETIRIGRVDDEQMMLTEDYRIGRITVELDTPKDGGQPVVTSSTVELPDGPQTFTLKG